MAIADEIVHVALSLSSDSCYVVGGQLLPFPALIRKRHIIIQINRVLQERFQLVPHVKYWQHRGGFWNPVMKLLTGQPSRTLFDADGTHLCNDGYLKYVRSIKVAIAKAL